MEEKDKHKDKDKDKDILVVEEARGIARVTMNRPERFNALSPAMAAALRHFFQGLARRHDVRVVILKGAGKHFCAGLDLTQQKPGAELGPEGMMDIQHDVGDIMLAMRRCPQPVISIVHGAASGGGFALALASDVRLGTPDARMNAAAIKIGLTGGDMGISYFLPRMIGSSAAAEYLLTGRFIDAPRAFALGLFSRLGSKEELEREAQSLADDMLGVTPLGLRMTKEGLTHAIDSNSLEAVMAMEDRQQVLCTQGDDFREGMQAFLEKRAPRYRRS